MTSEGIHQPARWPVALGLVVAAAAHIPVIPEHLHEAPYMGVAFIAFSCATATLAVVTATRPRPATFGLAGVVCGAAVIAYVLTRLIAFPELGDDVGNWSEPLGLVSITTEALVVMLSTLAVLRGSGPRLRWRAQLASSRS